jgi:hypothetical protein
MIKVFINICYDYPICDVTALLPALVGKHLLGQHEGVGEATLEA